MDYIRTFMKIIMETVRERDDLQRRIAIEENAIEKDWMEGMIAGMDIVKDIIEAEILPQSIFEVDPRNMGKSFWEERTRTRDR